MNRGRAWNWTFIAERRYLDPKRGHPTIAMVDHHLVYLKSHLEVYCLTHASCGEKNTVSVSTNPKVAFAVPMDARTCHFHRTVGYGANGCRKIRMSSRMMMMMRMRMMTMMLMMRHCEGAAAWRDAQGMWREFTWGGGMELDIQSRAEISGSEKRAPHDVHGCSSLSPFK